MIGASVEIVFPCPFVFEGHQLVHIYLPTVEQSLIFRVDAPGQVIRLASGTATQCGRHVSIIRFNGRRNTVFLRVVLVGRTVLHICAVFNVFVFKYELGHIKTPLKK